MVSLNTTVNTTSNKTSNKTTNRTIKRALISVSDKKNLIVFAHALVQLGIEIISTGGTSQALRTANIPTQDVSDLTGFPEIMNGRVKTLHPKIHGGILGQRDQDADVAKKHQITWIDLVVVNLYPFAETSRKPNITWDKAVEHIDIGGPSMIRSAAKNMAWVAVVVDPMDYDSVLSELQITQSLDFTTRQSLATKAFAHTAEYDRIISLYLKGLSLPSSPSTFSTVSPVLLEVEKFSELRYGENPHQSASAYQFISPPYHQANGVLSAKKHQGKALSYNNLVDADAAVACVQECTEKPACVIVKHANPCGAASASSIEEAFQQAWNADALSAFGGIVALNRPCTQTIAEALASVFIEVLIAPGYSPEALAYLQTKPNLRVLEYEYNFNRLAPPVSSQELKFIRGGLLIQDKDMTLLDRNQLKLVTEVAPTSEDITTMLFAAPILKYVKSNAIVIAKNNTTIGIGAGQVSRVDAVDIALKKAGEQTKDAVLTSDAFFPFKDSIERLAGTGIRAIMQPGGSIRDEEVIAACNQQKIAMVFTGIRCFKH